MSEEIQGQHRKAGISRCLAAIVIPGLLYSAPASAYLDPGTGSILLQGLLAGVAAVAAAGSIFWQRIKSAFSSLFSSHKSTGEDSDQGRGA